MIGDSNSWRMGGGELYLSCTRLYTNEDLVITVVTLTI